MQLISRYKSKYTFTPLYIRNKAIANPELRVTLKISNTERTLALHTQQ